MIDYVKLSIIAGLSAILFGSGWWMGYSRYLEYKKSVEIAAKVQEAENASKDKQAALITLGVKNEYQAKLDNLRNFYSRGLHVNSSSGKTEGISAAPTGTDASTAYSILVGQCSQTTLMLTELQSWVRQQVELK